jgi:hypothetical protein
MNLLEQPEITNFLITQTTDIERDHRIDAYLEADHEYKKARARAAEIRAELDQLGSKGKLTKDQALERLILHNERDELPERVGQAATEFASAAEALCSNLYRLGKEANKLAQAELSTRDREIQGLQRSIAATSESRYEQEHHDSREQLRSIRKELAPARERERLADSACQAANSYLGFVTGYHVVAGKIEQPNDASRFGQLIRNGMKKNGVAA